MNGVFRTAASTLEWFVPSLFFLLSSLLSLSCSSPHQTTADRPPAPIPYHADKAFVPAGWSAVSDGGKSSPSELLLVKNDGDAAMILRELKPAASAKSPLSEEDVCVLGNISMQNKLGADKNDREYCVCLRSSVMGKNFASTFIPRILFFGASWCFVRNQKSTRSSCAKTASFLLCHRSWRLKCPLSNRC